MSTLPLGNATSALPTLAQTIWPDDETRFFRAFALLVVGTLALWISAKVQVPFYPVPMTMQTFVVLVIGMAYGWKLGGATLLAYLAEGALGLPVFAGTPERGIGLAYMFGPTGGYLIGFFLAAVAVGYLAERGWDRSLLKAATAMLVGYVLIYTPGLIWLGTVIGWDKPILELGLTPFIWGAIFKAGLAAAVLPIVWRLLPNQSAKKRST